ncbi:MAG: DivIVA domain-containing protein [Mogibacterium sp.]|nr:DivIVA domain-containing protein [Mogibacterium sp.]MBR3376260.1 DivIVA domain-containing protein [Mogibacterium sp.]
MIMPIDIDKKEFSRDKKGYNSREVDEFLDLIVADYEKVLNDNRTMAHKIKALEKQLEEAQKDDNAMVETLETAKKLMADISASAERRAELMMRDAELEAENMLLDAKVNVRKLTDEHAVLSTKVRRLKDNFRKMLEAELARIDEDDFDLIRDLAEIELPKAEEPVKEETVDKAQTLVFDKIEDAGSLEVDFSAPTEPATLSDLSDSLKAMAEETSIDNTIILK